MSHLLDRLTTLAHLDGVSGHEHAVVATLLRALSPLVDEVQIDAAGNLYALLEGPAPGPTVMVAAHTDEIGMIVKAIEPSGFLRFEKIGGVLDNVLASRLVRVRGHLGVVGMRAGHVQTQDERSRVPSATRMYVDVGATSATDVASMGIEIGDPIAFVQEIRTMGPRGTLVTGQSIDDRLGCAVAWSLLERGRPPAGRLIVAFTVQEEVGLKGAGLAGARWQPDLALALDTMPTGDTPDMSLTCDLNVRLGGGPALQTLAGQAGRGFLVPPAVASFVKSVAQEAQIPLQLTTFSGGNNDAAAIAWSGVGVPAASICLPRRYSHSPCEIADLDDAQAALDLLAAIVGRMDRLPSFAFLSDLELRDGAAPG